MGCCKVSSKKEVYSDIGLPQETRKISNSLPPKRIRKRKTEIKVSRRKEIIKIREKIEIKKWKRSIKLRAVFLKR